MACTVNQPSDIITIGGKGTFEYEDRRSVFIGQVIPTSDADEARAFIDSVKKEYYDARHNVYAYIVANGGVVKYSDDGEPQGTAGIPVFNALKMSGAVNLCVTVTRYFGGILLGTGGLVRAYSAAAAGAISAAGLVTMTDFTVYEVICSYSEYQRLSDQLSRMGAIDEDSDFGADVTLRVSIESERGEELEKAVVEMTSGKCAARPVSVHKRPSRA